MGSFFSFKNDRETPLGVLQVNRIGIVVDQRNVKISKPRSCDRIGGMRRVRRLIVDHILRLRVERNEESSRVVGSVEDTRL